MIDTRDAFAWIDEQAEAMEHRLKDWSAINSGSYNLPGLETMWRTLSDAFSVLGTVERVPEADYETVNDAGEPITRKHGDALRLIVRPDAPRRALLVGHMDTVFPENSHFQSPYMIDDATLGGPGVADMKGGIMVMLHALQAFERTELAAQLGYEVLISSDEEIGSHGSADLLAESARRAEFGLVYEPALADGTLAGARRGSGDFVVVARGRSAHAGREPHLGRNAVVALSKFILALRDFNDIDGVSANPAKITGGGANNVVPDFALCRFNIRVDKADTAAGLEEKLETIRRSISESDEVELTLHGRFHRPAKTMTPRQQKLFDFVADAGAELQIPISYKPTGGCCDGNNLADAGLANVDTLGVRGGAIHSDKEFMILESLPERAKLSTLILAKAASDEAFLSENTDG